MTKSNRRNVTSAVAITLETNLFLRWFEFFEVLVAGSSSFLLLELVTTPRFELICVLPRNEKQMSSK